MELDGTLVSVKEILGYLTQDRYMGKREAAAYTGLSTRTLESNLDEIPHFRVGKKILFKKSELDRWMETHREGDSHSLDRIVDGAIESLKG
jgi:excisionase family DNA binding protein